MKKTILITIAILLIAAFGWAWATREPEEPEAVTEAKAVLETALDAEKIEEQSDEQRMETFKKLREMADAMPEEQRDQFRKAAQGIFISFMQQRLDQFFELPPEEQTKKLDQWIDRMEAGRARREERRKEREQSTAADAGETGESPATSDAGEGRRRSPFGDVTPEKREERHRRRLDSTTPKMRAQFQEFFRMLNERRKERGMPEMQRRF